MMGHDERLSFFFVWAASSFPPPKLKISLSRSTGPTDSNREVWPFRKRPPMQPF